MSAPDTTTTASSASTAAIAAGAAITAAAVGYAQYGPPDVLAPIDIPVPAPGPGQVRIRVRAVAVNPIDAKLRSGSLSHVFAATFPVVPGWDVAGVVEAVGSDAAAEVGDSVFGVAAGAGYAEYALLDHPVPMPDDLSFSAAAALPTVGEAAYRTLKHLDVRAGETLVIVGAGGSVGTVAVQLAVSHGVRVIAVAAERDHARLQELGAETVEYGDGWRQRAAELAPRGVDAVLDVFGGGVLADAVDLVGGAARVITTADETAGDHGVRFTGPDPADRFPEALPVLARLAATGELSLPIWRTYPLAEASRAHGDLEAHRSHGKIILNP
jgi:NADPH:quinone reductase-like Zn-dependent oxidoreductase